MGRLVFFVLLALVVAWWLFGRKKSRGADSPAARRPDKASARVDDMVACAHCGVHLPRAEALAEGDAVYCGDEHRRLGPRRP
jgi:uncharacterized protein